MWCQSICRRCATTWKTFRRWSTTFSRRIRGVNGRNVTTVDSDTIGFLQSYDWPGNVRELENYIERAVVLAEDSVIIPDLLPPHVRGEAPQRVGRLTRSDLQTLCTELVSLGLSQEEQDGAAYPHVMGMIEKELILQVLRMSQGTQTRGRGAVGNQSQYAAQEDRRVRPALGVPVRLHRDSFRKAAHSAAVQRTAATKLRICWRSPCETGPRTFSRGGAAIRAGSRHRFAVGRRRETDPAGSVRSRCVVRRRVCRESRPFRAASG